MSNLSSKIIDIFKLGISFFHFRKLYYNKLMIYLLKKIFPPDPNKRYLNIGGGIFYFPKWENIDYYTEEIYIDYKIDLRTKTPLPFPNNSVNIIFTCHVLEHLTDDQDLFLLKECYRILKPNGLLRISVPDMDKAINAYIHNNNDFFDKGGAVCKGDNIERKLVNFLASYELNGYSGGPIIPKNRIAEKFNTLDKYSFAKWCVSQIPESAPYKAHINAFDFKKLTEMIRNAGKFSKIEKSEYRKSKRKIFSLPFFDNRPLISLFVEVIK